jgi:hypothetical protein
MGDADAMSDDRDLHGAIISAIAAREDVPGALVTSYVVLAAFVDGDGVGKLYTETADGQRCHETLGLLSFAMATEGYSAATSENGE